MKAASFMLEELQEECTNHWYHVLVELCSSISNKNKKKTRLFLLIYSSLVWWQIRGTSISMMSITTISSESIYKICCPNTSNNEDCNHHYSRRREQQAAIIILSFKKKNGSQRYDCFDHDTTIMIVSMSSSHVINSICICSMLQYYFKDWLVVAGKISKE